MAMSKNKNKFKFCVGSSNEHRSNIWTVVQNKADVYMISRSFGKDFKVSIHGSGINQSAVTQDFMKKHDIPETERLAERWHYDAESANPQIIFSICFLSNQLIDFSDIDELDNDIIIIPDAIENCYVEVLVYKLIETPATEWNIPLGYHVLRHNTLSNGKMLVFMYHYPKLLEEHIKMIDDMSSLMRNKKNELGIGNRVVAAHFGTVNEAGQRRLCELYI
jgi:hypothetical protein